MIRDMQARASPLQVRALALDLLLAGFITVMQVQGTVARVEANPETVLRPLTDLGYLGYALLIVSGAALALRRQWPVAVFAITALASLTYYTLDFPDGPGWLGLFVALYTPHRVRRRAPITRDRRGRHRRALRCLAGSPRATSSRASAIGWVFFRIGASVMSAALGESVRSRRVIAADALERAELAERTREEEARVAGRRGTAPDRARGPRHRCSRHRHHQRAGRRHRAPARQATGRSTRGAGDDRADERPGAARDAGHPRRASRRSTTGACRTRARTDRRARRDGARRRTRRRRSRASPTPAALPSAVDSAAYRILQESTHQRDPPRRSDPGDRRARLRGRLPSRSG